MPTNVSNMIVVLTVLMTWLSDHSFSELLLSPWSHTKHFLIQVMSVKLWIILFVLRELLKVMKECSKMHENDSNTPTKAATAFAKNLLQMSPEDLVRPNEEQFLRNAIMAFPYKHLMLYQTLSRAFSQIKSGQPPSAFIVICQTLFGHRFVETAHFCATCGISAAQKRCKTCKVCGCFYLYICLYS